MRRPIPLPGQQRVHGGNAEAESIGEFIQELIEERKVLPASDSSVCITPLFVAQKGDVRIDTSKGWRLRAVKDEAEKKRLVWDMSASGSGFNDLCLELPFRYGDVARHMARCFQEGMRWAASFDERAFYHSVRVSKGLARWTALRDPRSDRVWCLHRMGFGASWACFVASLIMAEMLEVLRCRGMRLPFGFLDDGMTPGRTEDEANRGLLTAVTVSASGGL